LSRERVAVERAMIDRLRGGESEPRVANPRPERVPVAREDVKVPASPTLKGRKPAACAEILMRAQLGDLSEADRETLQQC
jgi:hypothetical protein